MMGYFVVGTLAAFGAFCAIWAAFGWLLPRGRGCAVVCYGMPDEGILTWAGWLRGAGFLNVPVIAVTEEICPLAGHTEICSPEALLSRLEQERNSVHGTGNGDYSGRSQRRGISEL